jgi:hypothetical protein
MKLLPPDHPDAPKYWIYETGGRLRVAVLAYLRGDRLTSAQILLIRAYLTQWCNSPVWAPDLRLEALRRRVDTISTIADITACIEVADLLGIDPL